MPVFLPTVFRTMMYPETGFTIKAPSPSRNIGTMKKRLRNLKKRRTEDRFIGRTSVGSRADEPGL
jgi:hypothetical protein